MLAAPTTTSGFLWQWKKKHLAKLRKKEMSQTDLRNPAGMVAYLLFHTQFLISGMSSPCSHT